MSELEQRQRLARSLENSLAIGFLVLSVGGWLRAVQAVRSAGWLEASGVQPAPAWIIVGGILWGVVCVSAAVALGLRSCWRMNLARGAAIVLAALSWLDRWLFTHSQAALSNTLFMVGATVLLVGMVWGITWVSNWLRRPPLEAKEDHDERTD